MKRVLFLLFVAVFFANVHCIYKKEYKLSIVVGPNSPWGQAGKYFAENVKKRTNGRINVRVYYGGQLFAGKQTNEFLLLRNGIADFAIASTINWSSQIKELNLFSLPFLFRDYKDIDDVLHSEVGKKIKKDLNRFGIVIIGEWGENGFREITNSKKIIKSPEDLRNLKVRVVGSPIFLDIFKALGANPLNMNWGDAQTAFRQGVVDAQENPIDTIIIPYKVYEFHKYITVWHYTFDPLMFAVCKRTWIQFSPQDKKIIEEVAKEAMLIEKAYARVGLDDGWAINYLKSKKLPVKIEKPYEFLKSKGANIHILTQKEYESFQKATQKVYKKWENIIGKTLIEKTQKIVKNNDKK